MILTILFLCLIFIISTVLISFLSQVFAPAVKKQTKLADDMLFHKIEHKFEKLSDNEETEEVTQRAYVLCSCNKTFSEQKNYSLNKEVSCSVIFTAYKSLNDCKYSCIGLGDCLKKCSQEAIYIENGTAKINEMCTGCGKCVSSCPKNLIKMVPVTEKEIVVCNNNDQSLTSCSALKKVETIEYPQKKEFKIWKFWYKLLK